ncbi:MAG: DUF1538 domain-containing protein [Schleiferiaceae bacterium]|nr:DUF1538 domain-containing protein [Schleiferiaceae bacterium]
MLKELLQTLLDTLIDVTPIVLLIGGFQIFVIKKSVPNLKKVLLGVVLVIFGLTFFLVGLEKALFPVGELMAKQLSDPQFIATNFSGSPSQWQAYYWVYLFAGLIGFATTVAEPSLLAVAIKAEDVSGGTISKTGLRLVVAVGVAVSLVVGTYRIVVGDSLAIYMAVLYGTAAVQTIFADKDLVALAYDSGGVTTSTVTVPIVAALGFGLASTVEGRNPALDGFGLIAFANVFPIISVLVYSQISALLKHQKK